MRLVHLHLSLNLLPSSPRHPSLQHLDIFGELAATYAHILAPNKPDLSHLTSYTS